MWKKNYHYWIVFIIIVFNIKIIYKYFVYYEKIKFIKFENAHNFEKASYFYENCNYLITVDEFKSNSLIIFDYYLL